MRGPAACAYRAQCRAKGVSAASADVRRIPHSDPDVPVLRDQRADIRGDDRGLPPHEATAVWDVSYAIKRRYVSPLEQHVHSFLEMTPLMAGIVVSIQHWGQLLALFGLGPEAARFALT